MDRVEAAATALDEGDLVVYPTETVYGLGAHALDPTAIRRVFEAKERPLDKPLSMAVPDIPTALEYVDASDRGRACMRRFLPGPVTVVCRKAAVVPDELTADQPRVGVRIPDLATALRLLERVAPITATSANLSGRESITDPADLDPAIRAAVAVILDDGRTPGGASTVVDPDRGIVHRRGDLAEEVEAWLDTDQ